MIWAPQSYAKTETHNALTLVDLYCTVLLNELGVEVSRFVPVTN
jgi:hypothetical protein